MAKPRPVKTPTTVLRISELEQATGVPRSTIYYYIREGLLPAAQKMGQTSAYYGEEHVRRLAEISELKRQRLALRQIRAALAARDAGDVPAGQGVDLAAERASTVRRQILEAATRIFAAKGYAKTRIADICAETGIAPATLYRHFATKRALFLEVVAVFADESHGYIEPLISGESDYIKRSMTRTAGWIGLRALSPDMLTFVRAEALGKDPDLQRVVRGMYRELLDPMADDLDRLLAPSAGAPPSELLAYAIQGIEEILVMRLSWDDRYTLRDYYATMLVVFLAIQAVCTGELDLADRRAAYAALVERFLGEPPLTPPGVGRP